VEPVQVVHETELAVELQESQAVYSVSVAVLPASRL